MTEWLLPLLAGIIGAAVAWGVNRTMLRHPPAGSLRTNVRGDRVPVVLGWGISAGSLAGLAVVSTWLGVTVAGCDRFGTLDGILPPACPTLFDALFPFRVPGLLLAGMFLAGLWDDRRGDERPRGFAGHLSAMRGGVVTGGVVKLVAGGVLGLATGVVLLNGVRPLPLLLLIGACIALSANAVNLLDRAPGRAAKVFAAIALPLALLGDPDWRILAAGTIGAAIAALPVDLRAGGMLGDAGANPLGAAIGLGLVVNSSGSVAILAVVVVLLFGLNLASERWSFSAIIERTPWLARLDDLGRK